MAAEKLKDADYQALAEFRYQIRCFLRFSEQAAQEAKTNCPVSKALAAVPEITLEASLA